MAFLFHDENREIRMFFSSRNFKIKNHVKK
jgi:hypothetical protein